MPFDFDSAVVAPFRMQPGLRRLAADAKHLTPVQLDARALHEKLAVLSSFASQALLCAPGFDPTAALDALAARAAAESAAAFAWDGSTARALHLRWSVREDTPIALDANAPAEIGACLAALPPGWRLAGLLSLAFAEDFAIVDQASGTIPWLAVCLPSHWAPETKVGRSFTDVHSPVADNELIVQAGAHLLRLVSGGSERWERFVWTITSHPRLHAHPDRLARERWPADASAETLAALAQWRTERQTFIALPASRQAVFTILVGLQPLSSAITSAEQALRLHDALATMSPAVLAYRNLAQAQPRLLDWLAARAAQLAK